MRNGLKRAIKKGAAYYVNTKNISGYTPLHLAVEMKDFELVQKLLKETSLVNVADMQGYTPLHLAVFNDYFQITEALVLRGANVNATSIHTYDSVLHFAATNGDEWIVDILLKNGANLLCQNKKGETPLEYMLKAKHQDLFLKAIKSKKWSLTIYDVGIFLRCLDAARKNHLKDSVLYLENLLGVNLHRTQ